MKTGEVKVAVVPQSLVHRVLDEKVTWISKHELMTTAKAESLLVPLMNILQRPVRFHMQIGFYVEVSDDLEAVEFTLKHA